MMVSREARNVVLHRLVDMLELGVRWYTVVYILDVYIGLTPLNCHNQVVNSNYILQQVMSPEMREHLSMLTAACCNTDGFPYSARRRE
jgi:hypothetical protein